jgi:hypothetical protein
MAKVAFALALALGLPGAAWADVPGYRQAYFAATTPGSWAQYTMKVEGQPDMGYRNLRLPDDAGRQRLQVRVEYMSAGAQVTALTDYVLKPGYSLEADALGFGKAMVAMSSSTPGARPTVMPAAVVESARQSMPDYGAVAQFVGTENIGGKVSDHYRYVQKRAGAPAQTETGDLWLDKSVPFGLVRQKAVTAEDPGKVISRFEMLLVDSGVGRGAAAKAPAGPGNAPVPLADAFRSGRVELAVAVVPGTGDGRTLRIGFRNKTGNALRLAIPAGATTLEVGSPIETLRLSASSARTLDIAAGATSPAADFGQTGTRRPVDGVFTLSVFEGTPLYSGSVTMGTVGR